MQDVKHHICQFFNSKRNMNSKSGKIRDGRGLGKDSPPQYGVGSGEGHRAHPQKILDFLQWKIGLCDTHCWRNKHPITTQELSRKSKTKQNSPYRNQYHGCICYLKSIILVLAKCETSNDNDSIILEQDDIYNSFINRAQVINWVKLSVKKTWC